MYIVRMKKVTIFRGGLVLLILLATGGPSARAQGVGIGTATPDASAALDITATGKGLLVPRLAQSQRLANASPATGLLVYQTNGSQPGF